MPDSVRTGAAAQPVGMRQLAPITPSYCFCCCLGHLMACIALALNGPAHAWLKWSYGMQHAYA